MMDGVRLFLLFPFFSSVCRAFYLGPGLNKRSKQFAVAHGLAVEDLPPGGPPITTGRAPRPADLPPGGKARDPQGELAAQLRNAGPRL
jgi:hypothetical protein